MDKTKIKNGQAFDVARTLKVRLFPEFSIQAILHESVLNEI